MLVRIEIIEIAVATVVAELAAFSCDNVKVPTSDGRLLAKVSLLWRHRTNMRLKKEFFNTNYNIKFSQISIENVKNQR